MTSNGEYIAELISLRARVDYCREHAVSDTETLEPLTAELAELFMRICDQLGDQVNADILKEAREKLVHAYDCLDQMRGSE